MYIHTYIHIYNIHTHLHTLTHTHTHTYIHIHTYIHVYMYIHTHTFIEHVAIAFFANLTSALKNNSAFMSPAASKISSSPPTDSMILSSFCISNVSSLTTDGD